MQVRVLSFLPTLIILLTFVVYPTVAFSSSELQRFREVFGIKLKNDTRRETSDKHPIHTHVCVHDLLDSTVEEYEQIMRAKSVSNNSTSSSSSSSRSRKRDESLFTQQMRVHMIIHEYDLSTEQLTLMKLIAEDVKTKFGELYRVDPLENKVVYDGKSTYCKSKGTALNTDLVIEVHPQKIETDNVLGYASGCSLASDGRPNYGYFVVEKDYLKPEYRVFLTGLFLHEATHVLGFSVNSFSSHNLLSFADPLYPERSGFTFDKILKYAQDYFNCPSIKMVEVENNGGSGTVNSHFEKRVFMNEVMTGSSAQIPSYSAFTLLVLEEIGFYGINWEKADLFGFGYKRGCGFVEKCEKDTWGSLYCTQNNELGCSADLSGPGICNVIEGKGTDELADKCPYFLNYPEKSCGMSRSTISGETFGAHSRCFMGSLLKGSPIATTRNGYCYEIECLSITKLKLKVGDIWVTCESGDTLSVPGYAGQIECPTVARMCAGFNPANAIVFPEFEKIEPGRGGSGTEVTIYGKNFNTVNGMNVQIDTEICKNVKVVSETKLTCEIGEIDFFSSLTSAITGKRRSVIVIDRGNSLSDVGSNVFELAMTRKDIMRSIEHFFERYTFLAVCIIVSIVSFLILGVFLIKQCIFPRRHNYTTDDLNEVGTEAFEESIHKEADEKALKIRKEKKDRKRKEEKGKKKKKSEKDPKHITN